MNEEKGILVQNVSKELIDVLGKKYPKGKYVFLDFINWFKKEMKWDSYFPEHISFLDLPVELQLGVVMQFANSIMNIYPPYPQRCGELAFLLEMIFEFIQNNNAVITKPETKSNLNVN